jgi:hypothetical protein
MKIEISIKDKDDCSSTILPDPPLSEVKTPPFQRDSHSDAYRGTSTVLVHFKFSTLQDHKEKLLLHHDPMMITSSVASTEYNDFSILFFLIGQFILHAQSTPKNINWITFSSFFFFEVFHTPKIGSCHRSSCVLISRWNPELSFLVFVSSSMINSSFSCIAHRFIDSAIFRLHSLCM